MKIDNRLAKMAPHLFDNVELERRKRELEEQRRWEALMNEIHGKNWKESPASNAKRAEAFARQSSVYRSEFEKR